MKDNLFKTIENFIQTLIDDIVINQTFNRDHPNKACSTTFFGHYYAVHILILNNNESGELEIKKIGDNLQDNNGLIFHNDLINVGGNQTTSKINEFDPNIQQ